MSNSKIKNSGFSSLGIPGRGLSYITPHLQEHKAARRKRWLRGIGLAVLLCLGLLIWRHFFLTPSVDTSSTLTVNDLVTQTWQAHTRMADAISTAKSSMLRGDSSILNSTIEPYDKIENVDSTPVPTLE